MDKNNNTQRRFKVQALSLQQKELSPGNAPSSNRLSIEHLIVQRNGLWHRICHAKALQTEEVAACNRATHICLGKEVAVGHSPCNSITLLIIQAKV